MSDQAINVLFLCTHNSARSILAEATLNHLGKGRFRAYSAGSSPRDNQQPNPLALQVLQIAGISTEGLRSKTWDEFGKPDARARRAGPPQASAAPSGGSALHEVKSVGAVPVMDLVITVCDNAAGEVCPYWPGQPATAHWGYADPSEGDGDDAQKLEAFRQTLHAMRRRLDLLVNLPPSGVGKLMLQTSARGLAKS
jgi:arsenate reductase (thioredoxin)